MTTQTEAMRLALEVLEQWNAPLYKRGVAITALREALAEQFCDKHCTWLDHHPDCDKAEQTDWEAVAADQAMTIAMLRAEEPRCEDTLAQQAEINRLVSFNQQLMDEVARLQKREWVGLTEAEVWDLWNANTEPPFPEWFVDFKRSYKVIEAKLKEKNT